MTERASLVEAEGEVHAVNILIGGEYTLCGDAFDLTTDEPGYEWTTPKRNVVTCEHCVRIILSLRGIRVDHPE